MKKNNVRIVTTNIPKGDLCSMLSKTIFENQVFETVSTKAVKDIAQVRKTNQGKAFFTNSNM